MEILNFRRKFQQKNKKWSFYLKKYQKKVKTEQKFLGFLKNGRKNRKFIKNKKDFKSDKIWLRLIKKCD